MNAVPLNTVFLDAATLTPESHYSVKDVFGDNSQLDMSPGSNDWDIDPQSLVKACQNLTCYAGTRTDQIIQRCQSADVIITNKVVLDQTILQQLPNLKLICIAATGTNNVDLAAAKAQGIAVTNVAGYSTQSVVQICFSLLLYLSSGLSSLQAATENAGWARHHQFVMLPQAFQQLAGKTLGILGYGAIGKAVADVARAFEMKVVVAQLPGRPAGYNRMALPQLLPKCDVVSLHCPLNDNTDKLVGDEFLSLMKPSSLLLNTARGGLIDEAALANALLNGSIAGAGLDVLSTEPPDKNNPLLNAEIRNIIVTPHVGWASQQARQTLINELAKNLTAFEHNNPRNRIV